MLSVTLGEAQHYCATFDGKCYWYLVTQPSTQLAQFDHTVAQVCVEISLTLQYILLVITALCIIVRQSKYMNTTKSYFKA